MEDVFAPGEFYNNYYAKLDDNNCIVEAWSDGPNPQKDLDGAIKIGQGGYQLRLFPGGEENPPLYDIDGILLYKWDGKQVVLRTDAELAADRLPLIKAAKLSALSSACGAAITAGCDVSLSAASGHISLTAEDQINLSTAVSAVEQGAAGYPYHLDGQLCALYPASDIDAMAQAATAHKLYHTTYYNHLAAWVRRCETADEVQAITYGADLPGDLADNMAVVLAAAGGGTDAV